LYYSDRSTAIEDEAVNTGRNHLSISNNVVFQFEQTDGGLFTFDSFDARTGHGGSGISDTWSFLGQVSGSQTESFTYSTPFVSTTVLNTVTPNFNQPIDTLLIAFVQKNRKG
jgi:hypothetical protein